MNVSISQWISQKLQTLVPFSPRPVLNKAVESLFKKRTQTQQLNYPSLIQSRKNLNVSPLRESNITHLLKNRSLFNYRNQQGENHSWMFRDFGRSMCSTKEKVSKSQKSAKRNENHPLNAGNSNLKDVWNKHWKKVLGGGGLIFSFHELFRYNNSSTTIKQKTKDDGISIIGNVEKLSVNREKKKSTTSPSPTGSSSVENKN